LHLCHANYYAERKADENLFKKTRENADATNYYAELLHGNADYHDELLHLNH